jgi:histidinol-phosphate phosphatase family protein
VALSALAKAVFLDKDGTLIEDVPYNVDPARIELTAGAGRGLRALADAGFRLFVVSNQSGVARGYFAEMELAGVERRLHELFAECGVKMGGFYYCPHHSEGRVRAFAMTCGCGKPAPGLILRVAQQGDIDLARSWLIGDILDDIEAGLRAGCRTVLLDNGHETEWVRSPLRTADVVAKDLTEAAKLIVSRKETRRRA